MNYGDYIKKCLDEKSDEKYRNFSSKLTPTGKKIIGVRVPEIRAFAKKITGSDDWQKYLDSIRTDSLEETTLYGCIIGYAKTTDTVKFELLRNFVPMIDNWATCDIAVSTMKFMKKSQAESWNFLLPYFNSDKEFQVRFAFVSALDHFINRDYLERIFEKAAAFRHNGYYAKMAVAWTLATAMAKYRDETLSFLKNTHLQPDVRKMTVRKIQESYRVDNETKKLVKLLKSNL